MKLHYYHYTDSSWDFREVYLFEGYILETEFGAFMLDDGGYEEIIDFKDWVKHKYNRYSLTFDIVELYEMPLLR